jgi:hypothetical protein
MSIPMPKRLAVQYDDGSNIEVDFADLTHSLQQEILRQPALCRPNTDADKENFVLLDWEDGWQEIIQVGSGCTEINRYYVITRPEEVGSLSLKKTDGYPELIEILRKPFDLKTVGFVDSYQVSLERSAREGKEVDHFFSLEKQGDALKKAMKSFQKAVTEEGIDLEALQSQEPDQVRRTWEKIARRMGIVASRRQQDVLDFVAYLAKNQP